MTGSAPGRSAEALALLERAIAAHGFGPARVRLSYRGTSVLPDQSTHPDSPFPPRPALVDVALDEAAGALAFRSHISIAGDFVLPRHVGFSRGRGFAIRFTGEYDTLTELPQDANAYFPHRLLRTIRDNAVSLELVRSAPYDRLIYRLSATGAPAILLLEPSTQLLLAIQRPRASAGVGDLARDTVYGPYRRVGTVMVPETIAFGLSYPALDPGGLALSLVEATPAGPTAAELRLPEGARLRRASSSAFETVSLGRGVWLLRNVATDGPFSYNVLVVEFHDHVLISEAALNDTASARVLETVAGLAPGKPIRTLVQTHHHGDHIGGIRTYLDRGATIVTPLGMRNQIERIAAHFRTPPPRIEEVTRERIIRDAHNEVRIYDLPGDHAAHMLVVYLPGQRVLYQGDLISAGELPLYPASRAFLAWLRERRIAVDHLSGLHGRTVSGTELQRLIAREELAASLGD